MKKIITRINRTLFELMTGILIFGFLCQLVLIFLKAEARDSLGLWIGIVMALAYAWHMWYSLERGLELSESDAGKYLAARSAIRYIVVVSVLAVLGVTSAGNVLTAFIGVMGLKIGAYAQPLTKKLSRFLYGEEILPEAIIEERKENEVEETVQDRK